MLRVELRRRGKTSALFREGPAVLIDDQTSLYLIDEEGTRRRVAWRVGRSGESWRGEDGSKVYPPLIHDLDGDSVLHFRGEHADGKKGPWTLKGRADTPILVLRRRDDRSQTPNLCYLGLRGWGQTTLDINRGEAEIMLAPAGFSLESLHARLAAKAGRSRLGALAGS